MVNEYRKFTITKYQGKEQINLFREKRKEVGANASSNLNILFNFSNLFHIFFALDGLAIFSNLFAFKQIYPFNFSHP
jgi:hypothetical protein